MTTVLILVVCWAAVLVFALALCKIAAAAERDSEQMWNAAKTDEKRPGCE
jgi:hypothetical protein